MHPSPPVLPPESAALAPLLTAARAAPERCDFVPLVALLERALGVAVADLDRAAPLLLRAADRLGYHPSEITSLAEPAAPGAPWILTTPLLGLTGPGTPLPLALAQALGRGDHPRRDLLHAVQHTLLALLYRSRAALTTPSVPLLLALAPLAPTHPPYPLHLDPVEPTHPHRPLPIPLAPTPPPRLLPILLAPPSPQPPPPTTPLAFTSTSAAVDPLAPAPSPPPSSLTHPLPLHLRLTLLAFTLHAPGSARTLARALRALLADHLHGADLLLDDLAPAWIDLDDRPRLAAGARLAACTLGGRLLAHGRRLRLRIGPLPLAACPSFRPHGLAHARLLAALAILLPRTWPFELILTVHDPTACPPALGAARLGDDAWLTRRRPGVAAERAYTLAP